MSRFKKRNSFIQEKTRIICVEGPSGAGKSTLIELFPENYMRCPLVSEFIGGFPTCGPGIKGVKDNFESFIQGEIQASILMKNTPNHWIQDRNWISQITFLIALAQYNKIKIQGMMKKICEYINNGILLLPNLIIYIRCTPEMTKKRRLLRNTTLWGDVPTWIPQDVRQDFRIHRYHAYEKIFSEVPLNKMVFNADSIYNLFDLENFQIDNTYFKLNKRDIKSITKSILRITNELK